MAPSGQDSAGGRPALRGHKAVAERDAFGSPVRTVFEKRRPKSGAHDERGA
jgi:hypothetical protein